MDNQLLKNIIEAALLAAARPMSINELLALFPQRQRPEKSQVRDAIKSLQENYDKRGIELVEVASGFRMQVRPSMIDWLTKLWEERPPRYSRALLETLSLVAYRQPITRGDIENVRGVAVSSNIMRTLLERGWVRIVGHRDVPGKPALYGTTPLFLDYFGLKKLDDLPPLAEIKDLDAVIPQLELGSLEPGATLRVVVNKVDDDNTDAPADAAEVSQAADLAESSVDAPGDDGDLHDVGEADAGAHTELTNDGEPVADADASELAETASETDGESGDTDAETEETVEAGVSQSR